LIALGLRRHWIRRPHVLSIRRATGQFVLKAITMCAINLDCWLCALGASEKILFSQLAPKGTCHRRGMAVTNYSFCLGRSQTFLISYQRSSATLRS